MTPVSRSTNARPASASRTELGTRRWPAARSSSGPEATESCPAVLGTQVEDLLARGISQAQIARQLDLTKSTIAYHVRALGIRADPRFARRHDWASVQRAIDEEGLSMIRCIRRFGFSRDTWYRAVRRGDVVPRPHEVPLDDLLVRDRRQTNRCHLKRRLIRAGLKENRCEICGISEWQGKPLSLELHHINGDGADNCLENLQLLCGNCHSQTDNWGGRGRSAASDHPHVTNCP